MIRSSKHTLKFTNTNKLNNLYEFRKKYQQMVKFYIDYIWNNNPLNCPNMLYSNICNQINTGTARLRQCAAKQACSMIHAATKKYKKRLYKLSQLMSKGKNTKKLQAKINQNPLVRPNADNINPELDQRFVDIQNTNNHFNVFINIKFIGNIPINHTKVSNKWLKKGQLKSSLRIEKDNIVLFYEIPNKEKKNGQTLGADQGITTCLSLSDGQITKKNKHGYDLTKIQEILARRKKGSNRFKQTQSHRKNYINWSINQLNFKNIKQVKLEKIKNIRKNKISSRFNSHWTYTLIKQKLVNLGETKGFSVIEQDNKYRSQRCNSCGWVHQSNRKGKTFKCNKCNYFTDADLNAASNHEIELYELPNNLAWLREKAFSGFYWLEDGLFNVSYEPIVHNTQKT